MFNTPQLPGDCGRETSAERHTGFRTPWTGRDAGGPCSHALGWFWSRGPCLGAGEAGRCRLAPGSEEETACERMAVTLLQGVTWPEPSTRSSVSPPSPQSTLSPPLSAFKAVLGSKEAGQGQRPAMSGPGKGPRWGGSQPCGGQQRPGSNPQLAVGFWLSGLAAGAGWSGDPVGLVLGLLASALAPVFHLPSPNSLSAGFHVPGWEHRVWKDTAGSGPLSPCWGSAPA